MKRLALVALAACSGPTRTHVIMRASDAPPAYGTTPFPTDALRDGDHLTAIPGIENLVARHGDLVAAHVAALDGFGVRPLIEFFVDGPVDPATIDGGLVALDDGTQVSLDWHYDADRGVIQASPTRALREGTRYAAYVTPATRDPEGAPLAGELDLPGARWQSTRDALASLPQVAGVAVFTTQHATAPLVAARAQLPVPTLAFDDPAIIFSGTAQLDRLLGHATRATDGPRAGLERWGNDNPTGIAHDHVGVIGTGQMTIARFRRDDTGTDAPDDETFADPPAIVSIDHIPVTFILPAAPPPPDGYPVVIYGHGLGAGRDQLLSFAEPLTSHGFAVVGIDMFGHGSRFDPTDAGNNLASQLPHFSGDPNLRDGFGDRTGLPTTFDFFEGFLNVAAVRDSIRQSALDLGELSLLLRDPQLDLTALGGAKLDTRHLAYLGESFGTVVGTLFAATEPAIDLYVLDVPGGGILDKLLPASAEIGSLAMPLIQSIYGPKAPLDRWSPLIALMQSVIDGADPLTYAPTIHDRSMILLEVVGDQVLSNTGTDALARGLGLDVLTPDLAPPDGLVELPSPIAGNRDSHTSVLVQYSPATHGANWSCEHGVLRYLPGFPQPGDDPFPKLAAPITIPNPIYETLAQVTEILETHQAGEPPRVRSTLAPVADFDADGVPDSSDPAPYDPTIP